MPKHFSLFCWMLRHPVFWFTPPQPYNVIPQPPVSYRHDFRPILHFQPSSSQSDSRLCPTHPFYREYYGFERAFFTLRRFLPCTPWWWCTISAHTHTHVAGLPLQTRSLRHFNNVLSGNHYIIQSADWFVVNRHTSSVLRHLSQSSVRPTGLRTNLWYSNRVLQTSPKVKIRILLKVFVKA